jgi:hypothetical protein
VELLAHPFRLRPNKTAATVTQGSDSANAQLVAALVLTRYHEREMAPGFGTSDPVMVGLDPTEIVAQAAYWGPDVQITNITQQPTSADGSAARIEFQ